MCDMAIIETALDQKPTGARWEIERDSFAPVEDESEAIERASLIIASFNIRYAVGSFLITGSLLRRAGFSLPRRRPALVQRHLQQAALALTDGARLPPVDILAAQEADKGTVCAGGHHVARGPGVSDHWPIWVEVELEADGGPQA
jgi:hypothetical protein